MARGTRAQARELFHALTGEYANPSTFDSGWQRVVKAAARRWSVTAEQAEAALAEPAGHFFAGHLTAREAIQVAVEPAALGSAEAAPQAPTRTGRRRRTGTKQQTVVALLRRPEGADVDQIAAATGWKRPSIRGFLSSLEIKLGLKVVGKPEGGRHVYRIAPAPEA